MQKLGLWRLYENNYSNFLNDFYTPKKPRQVILIHPDYLSLPIDCSLNHKLYIDFVPTLVTI
jgi:hypothetical protein